MSAYSLLLPSLFLTQSLDHSSPSRPPSLPTFRVSRPGLPPLVVAPACSLLSESSSCQADGGYYLNWRESRASMRGAPAGSTLGSVPR